MNINTLQVSEYKGYKIYIRNFSTTFEYLVIMDNELYTTHIKVTKKPLQWLLGLPWKKEQLESITKMLIPVAQTTIDTVLEQKGK